VKRKNYIFYHTVCIIHISDKFKKFFKNNRFIRLAYMGINKLSSFIKRQKNKLPIYSRSNVVYKIHYKNCDAFYVSDDCYRQEYMNIGITLIETQQRSLSSMKYT